MNNTHTRRVPALVVACAFAMLAFAAIPTDAKAASYSNVGLSVCGGMHYSFCGDAYYYGDDYGIESYGGGFSYGYNTPSYYYPQQYYTTYQYPVYYTYPTMVQQHRPSARAGRGYRVGEPDYFFRDYFRAGSEFDQELAYYYNYGL